MGGLSVLDALQLLTSSGVLAGGLGILKWGLSVERRLIKLEVKGGIDNGKA